MFVHVALFHDSSAHYAAAVGDFVAAGLAAEEPVLVAVPADNAEVVRDALGELSGGVTFVDMAVVGANPVRIIPAVADFIEAHRGRRVRVVGESIWAARSPAEVREATRHEALINAAFADAPVAILCPYDTLTLDRAVLQDASGTHPVLDGPGGRRPSPGYSAVSVPARCDRPLSEPPAHAQRLEYTLSGDLIGVREMVAAHAGRAGLSQQRMGEFAIAVGEISANTLCHTTDGGTCWVWQEADRLICQIRDGGRIPDPLAGRRRPPTHSPRGRGLWMVNHLCDLVETRSDEHGTTTRLHITLR